MAGRDLESRLRNAEHSLRMSRHANLGADVFWQGVIDDIKQQIADRDRTRFTAADIEGSTHVRLRDGWSEVVRITPTGVTVAIGENRAQHVRFAAIREARKVAI